LLPVHVDPLPASRSFSRFKTQLEQTRGSIGRFIGINAVDFQLNLDSETVNSAHPTRPLVVDRQAAVRAVLELLRDQKQGAVLVCDGDGKLLGIWTERDAARLLAGDFDLELPIEQVMVRDPVVLSPGDTVGRAISLMASGGYRRLPIVDPQGRPTGVLNVAGILHFLVEHFPKVVYTLPPQPHQSPQEREGA
jgi:CBS domain-containing protein